MSLVFDDRNVTSFHLPISLFEILRSLTSSILILEIIFNVQFSRYHLTDDLSVIQDQKLSELESLVNTSVYKHLCRWYFIYESVLLYFFKGFRQPPALPYRLQHSTIGRLGLNHRVRDENGCVPQAHRHQKCSYFGFLHRRCALRITTSSLSFFLIYLFGKSTVMQPLLLPFP